MVNLQYSSIYSASQNLEDFTWSSPADGMEQPDELVGHGDEVPHDAQVEVDGQGPGPQERAQVRVDGK